MVPPVKQDGGITQGQIDQLRGDMTTGFNEIKNMLLRMDDRMRAVESKEAGCYPLVNQRVQQLADDNASLMGKVDVLDKKVSKLEHSTRVVTTALYALSVPVAGMIGNLLWQIFLGQVVVK